LPSLVIRCSSRSLSAPCVTLGTGCADHTAVRGVLSRSD
jgi:hypothetical protein